MYTIIWGYILDVCMCIWVPVHVLRCVGVSGYMYYKYACVCMRVHRSSVSPSKGTFSRSMWMYELSSLQTQPMGVRLNEGRERMSACRVGIGSGSSVAALSCGSSKVSVLGTLSKPPNGNAVLGRKKEIGSWGETRWYKTGSYKKLSYCIFYLIFYILLQDKGWHTFLLKIVCMDGILNLPTRHRPMSPRSEINKHKETWNDGVETQVITCLSYFRFSESNWSRFVSLSVAPV